MKTSVYLLFIVCASILKFVFSFIINHHCMIEINVCLIKFWSQYIRTCTFYTRENVTYLIRGLLKYKLVHYNRFLVYRVFQSLHTVLFPATCYKFSVTFMVCVSPGATNRITVSDVTSSFRNNLLNCGQTQGTSVLNCQLFIARRCLFFRYKGNPTGRHVF